jgi:type II secretory pathway pseudopilin PulG
MRDRTRYKIRNTGYESPSTLDSRHSTREAGFTYIGLLFVIALSGLGLGVTGEAWRTTMQREKERELLFIGEEFRKAITDYYDGTPGGVKQFPGKLEDLLKDERYPTTRRYLRKVYRDPMTGKREWGLIRGPGDRIMGVYSLSRQAPLKRANFPPDYAAFRDAKDYTDWQFAYAAAGAPQASPGVAPPSSSPLPASSVVGKTPETPVAQEPGGAAQRK